MSYKITTDPTLSPPSANAMISFMESFYQISDNESKHAQYVACFTPDATLIMGPKVANGADGSLPPAQETKVHVNWSVPSQKS
jgi:hypothetical protein